MKGISFYCAWDELPIMLEKFGYVIEIDKQCQYTVV